MDHVVASASPAAQSAPVALPTGCKLAYTNCCDCPCASWNPSQDAYWCSRFHSHYDGYDGCSQGPRG